MTSKYIQDALIRMEIAAFIAFFLSINYYLTAINRKPTLSVKAYRRFVVVHGFRLKDEKAVSSARYLSKISVNLISRKNLQLVKSFKSQIFET